MPQGNGIHERIATIGGTFDTLHSGHKEYIRLAFEYAERVLIYVNSDEFAKGKKDYTVRAYDFRKTQLENYLSAMNFQNRCEINCLDKLEELEKAYLSTNGIGKNIYLAVVSPEYFDFFQKINQKRELLQMKSFLILVKQRTRNEKNLDISSSTQWEEFRNCPLPAIRNGSMKHTSPNLMRLVSDKY